MRGKGQTAEVVSARALQQQMGASDRRETGERGKARRGICLLPLIPLLTFTTTVYIDL